MGTSLYRSYCSEVHLLNQRYLHIKPAVGRDLRTVKVRSSAYKCYLRAGPWLLPSREPSACPLLLSRSPLYVQSVRGAVKSIQFLVFNVKCALDHFITIKDTTVFGRLKTVGSFDHYEQL